MLHDIRETRVYRDAFQEGFDMGFDQGLEIGRRLVLGYKISKLAQYDFPPERIAKILDVDVEIVRQKLAKTHG